MTSQCHQGCERGRPRLPGEDREGAANCELGGQGGGQENRNFEEAESRERGLRDQERQGLVGGLGTPGLEEWWDEGRLPGLQGVEHHF